MQEKTTALFDEHKILNARMAGFGGWLMPIQYEGIIAEHSWCRSACSLFDICHMGEFMFKADPVDSGLEKIFSFSPSKMREKTCRYGFMLNEQGTIIDDVIIYKINKEEFMLVVNAATTPGDEAHLKKHLARPSVMKNISSDTCKLDLQGPLSAEALEGIVSGIKNLRYYTFDYFTVLGEKIIISRTGYTGELGYELYISKKNIKKLWEILLADKRVKPAGLGARDTLRLEMGYPLYGQDIDLEHNPLEAGLSGFVDFDKDFIGKSALEKINSGHLKKQMAYFISESRRAPRHNYKVYAQNQEIGVVTSGSFSPSLSCGIAMGYIDTSCQENRVVLKQGNIEIQATLTNKPFYKKGTARN